MKYRPHEPVVGSWFINRTGKLMKVKLILFRHEEPIKVMIEFIEGQRKVVTVNDWYCLELNRHISLRGDARVQS